LTIDARDILEAYEGYEWMKDVTVEKVAICRMGAQIKDDGDEEYVIEGEIAMPR
jgi:activating signal cointegrator complex subunit 1